MDYMLPFTLSPWDLKSLGTDLPNHITHQLCELSSSHLYNPHLTDL